jgi:hypothetical protein
MQLDFGPDAVTFRDAAQRQERGVADRADDGELA